METHKPKKIESLQTLRAIAFIGIFLDHAGVRYKWPALGVSIFYVLSGFLMIYRYYYAEMNVSIKDNARFSFSKIKKIYPLHILTMICVIFLQFMVIVHYGVTFKSIINLLGKIILNTLLLQTWVPDSTINVSLNGVAWYLSVTMFLYFCFPNILKWIKHKKIKLLLAVSIIILIGELLICAPLIYILGSKSHVYIWFMYCFPIFRLGDFFIGCCLGKYYLERERKDATITRSSIIEALAITLTVLIMSWMKVKYKNPFLLAMHNWTTLYIPIATVWVYLFTINKGIIIKIFNNKLLIFIGDISAYAFLIHFVVIKYTNAIISFFNITLTMWSKLSVIGLEFILSILLSYVYMLIKKKNFLHKNK